MRLKKRGFDAWDVSPVGPGFDGAKRLRGWEKRCLVKQIRCCYQVCRSQLMLREKVSFYVLLLPFFSFNARFLVFLYLFCIEVYQYFPLGCFFRLLFTRTGEFDLKFLQTFAAQSFPPPHTHTHTHTPLPPPRIYIDRSISVHVSFNNRIVEYVISIVYHASCKVRRLFKQIDQPY